MHNILVFEDENCDLLTWNELGNNEQLLSGLDVVKIPSKTMVAKISINNQHYCFVSIKMKKELLINLESKQMIGDFQLFNDEHDLLQLLKLCVSQQLTEPKQF